MNSNMQNFFNTQKKTLGDTDEFFIISDLKVTPEDYTRGRMDTDFGWVKDSNIYYTGLIPALEKSNYIELFDNRLEGGSLGPVKIERLTKEFSSKYESFLGELFFYQITNLESQDKNLVMVCNESESCGSNGRRIKCFEYLLPEFKNASERAN